MVLGIFEGAEQRRRDLRDLESMHDRYGDDIVPELERRANDETLRERDRKHWSRLLRKARALYSQ